MEHIEIEHLKIGLDYPPIFIAELSANHNQSIDTALSLVDAAKKAGAHAIKLQTYTPDTLTLNIDREDFIIQDPNSLWTGRLLYDLYKEAYTPWEWHQAIFEHSKKLGMLFFSSPFDETAVDFLETLQVPCYKIASFEITNIPLIEKIASTGKPLIISVGGATFAEIDTLFQIARKCDIILLKCTSAYPALPGESNLLTIPYLREKYNVPVGFSDHTLGIGTAIASIALGASLIEKHFTLSRADGGPDAAFSLEPQEFETLVNEGMQAYLSLGKIQEGPTVGEINSLHMYRKSLYFVRDLKQGDPITKEDIKIIRPAKGAPPSEYRRILGKKVLQDVKRGDPVHSHLIGT